MEKVDVEGNGTAASEAPTKGHKGASLDLLDSNRNLRIALKMRISRVEREFQVLENYCEGTVQAKDLDLFTDRIYAQIAEIEKLIDQATWFAIANEDDDIEDFCEEICKRLQETRLRSCRVTDEARKAFVQSPHQTVGSEPNEVSLQAPKANIQMPSWNGKIEDFFAWQVRVGNYFNVCRIKDDQYRLLLLRGEGVLSQSAELATRSCKTEKDFWKCLEERFSNREVRMAIQMRLDTARPLMEKSTSEVTRILETVTDFILRMEDIGQVSDVECTANLARMRQLLGDVVYHEFIMWLDAKFDRQEWNLRHLETYLRSLLDSLPGGEGSKTEVNREGGERRNSVETWMSKVERGTERIRKPFPKKYPIPSTTVPSKNVIETKLNALEHVTPDDNDDEEEENIDENQGEPRLISQFKCYNDDPLIGVYSLDKTGSTYFMPTTFAEVEGKGNGYFKIPTLLDEGSDITLVSSKAVKILGLNRGQESVLRYRVVGGSVIETPCWSINIKVKTQNRNEIILKALEVGNIGTRTRSFPRNFFEKNGHLRNIENCFPVTACDVELLVGYQHKELTLPIEIIRSEEDDKKPIGLRTSIGWTVFCPLETLNTSEEVVEICRVEQDAEELAKLSKDFERWAKGEVLGVEASQHCRCLPKQVEEANFFVHMKNTIRRTEEGRLEVKMPWKSGFPQKFKNNRSAAVAFLKNLQNTLRKKGVQDEYSSEMARIIKEYAEPVPESEIFQTSAWYLQHFLVENKTKLRIVWNSAAVFQGISLNEGLESGPNLLNDLTEVLLKFRKHPVAIQADVAKMFNQVQISEADRDYHRFLWDGKDYRWRRLPFGDKPAPDLSVYCLQHLAEERYHEFFNGAVAIKSNTYVDDILVSCESIDQALETARQVEEILSGGCFEIKGWHSNIHELETAEPCEETGVLGLIWHKSVDKLFVPPVKTEMLTSSRRQVLSTLSKFWDPLGMLAPLMVEAKIAMQRLWDTTVEWDELLSDDRRQEWLRRFDLIGKGSSIGVSRSIVPITDETILHGFCDASDEAYGAVFWLSTGVASSFLMAKTMVAPLKVKTIPRLELLAAQLAVRMQATLVRALGKVKTVLWSDSEVVLHWLKTGSKKYKAFVSARLQEIHENLDDADKIFRHIDGKINPADWLTKPLCNPDNLSTWLEGPSFIRKPELEWPSHHISSEVEVSIIEEKKEKKKQHKRTKRKPVSKTPPELHFQKVKVESITTDLDRNLEQANSWEELISLEIIEGEGEVSVRDRLFHEAQKGLDPMKFPSVESNLRRKQGRLMRTELPEHMKTPIILDGNSKITKLWFEKLHKESGHRGRRFLKNYAFTEKGILSTNEHSVVKEIVDNCEVCKAMRGNPHTPIMGQLPKERTLIKEAPFSACGVDFIGPVTLSNKEKAYILLFTCLTTRVCHLEVTMAMTTEAVVDAWRRFISRRGICPSYVLSDQARSFVKAKPFIEQLYLDTIPVRTDLKNFKWEFTHPRAPHRRGVIEALVKSIKRALHLADQKTQPLDTKGLETTICEINFLMNSRPLVCEDPERTTLPLTGNWLLHPYRNYRDLVEVNSLIESANRFTKEFWDEWITNVPRQLFEFYKWDQKKPNPKVGDKVLIIRPGYGNKPSPRKYWPQGTIIKCQPSKDGVVRRVLVQLPSGNIEKHVVQNLVIISNIDKF